MNARTLLTTTTVAAMLTVALPAKAADPQLLNLVMPDAKVLAGVNVDQAKTTPFGQYVLGLIQSSQNQHLQELTAQTGFDPTRDVHEVLVATPAVPAGRSGLFLARGNFQPATILSLATQHGAASETYAGVAIIEDPKAQNGVAFLSSTIVVAGDLASVKGAIDRQTKVSGLTLPATLITQVTQWSGSEDAWAISLVPTASLKVPNGAPNLPGVGAQGTTAFQSIQQAAGGVKFGTNVVVTAQAQADTAQNAQSMGDALKLLASLAQMQSQNNAAVTALLAGLTITPAGNLLNVTVRIPEDQIQQFITHGAAHAAHRGPRKM
jgi:hypothetical protein